MPVTLADLGSGFTYTLADGEVTAKSGGTGLSDLRKVLRPIDEGGRGGAVSRADGSRQAEATPAEGGDGRVEAPLDSASTRRASRHATSLPPNACTSG